MPHLGRCVSNNSSAVGDSDCFVLTDHRPHFGRQFLSEMGRYKGTVRLSRDRGLPNKRDTPVKTALSRRDKCRRLLPIKHYEAIPEEPEVDKANVLTIKPSKPVLAGVKSVHCKSVLRLSDTACAQNARGKDVSPAAPADTRKTCNKVAPAGSVTIQMTPDTGAFKAGDMAVKEDKQNLAVSSGNITSCMETDTTFSSRDNEEGSCSSASTTSSDLSSPEIFRNESNVGTLTLSITEELMGLNVHTKNSTLLDVSHAESIHMYHHPNLSVIFDASAILTEKNCETNRHRRPEAEAIIHTDTCKSDKSLRRKTPPKVASRRPIRCKKKVSFKSPVVAKPFEAIRTPATKLTTQNGSEPVRTSSLAEQVKPGADTSRVGEISYKEKALPLRLTQKRPVKSSPEKAKLFDFVNNSDRDAFFQRMRERCVKLRSAPLFPLSAARHAEPSAM